MSNGIAQEGAFLPVWLCSIEINSIFERRRQWREKLNVTSPSSVRTWKHKLSPIHPFNMYVDWLDVLPGGDRLMMLTVPASIQSLTPWWACVSPTHTDTQRSQEGCYGKESLSWQSVLPGSDNPVTLRALYVRQPLQWSVRPKVNNTTPVLCTQGAVTYTLSIQT